MRVLTVNGSYRKDGVTDQVLREITRELEEQGVAVDSIVLRDEDVAFCNNCRHCAQAPGCKPGECVHADAMAGIVRRIECADAIVLAAPTNMGSVTALFKRFMERLAVYAYWPWGAKAPKYRKDDQPAKKALLISSSAAPAALARPLFSSMRQLKATARTVGARRTQTLFFGLMADQPEPRLRKGDWKKIRRATSRLVG